MTTTTTDAPSRSTLPPGALACRYCGVAVRDPDPARAESVTILGPRLDGGRGAPAYDQEVPLTSCDLCAARRATAASLLAAYPAVGRAYGDVAIDRLDSALMALDVLGDKRGRGAAKLVRSAQQLGDLIEALSSVGAGAYWARSNVRPGAFSPRRWSHVDGQLAVQAREAHRALLRRPFETVGAVPPPVRAELRGCVLCGVGSVPALESKAPSIWGDQLRIPLWVFNAGPEVVTGHACPACTIDLEAVGGAIGYPVVWRALSRARGFEPLSGRTVTGMPGVTPWAATGDEPNETPWAHLDLAVVDGMLSRSRDMRRIAA